MGPREGAMSGGMSEQTTHHGSEAGRQANMGPPPNNSSNLGEVGWLVGLVDQIGRDGDRGTWERLEKIIYLFFLKKIAGWGYQECSSFSRAAGGLLD
jgi:hypothetical protein